MLSIKKFLKIFSLNSKELAEAHEKLKSLKAERCKYELELYNKVKNYFDK